MNGIIQHLNDNRMSHRTLYFQHAAYCEEMRRRRANQRAARLKEENEELKKELETLKKKK